MKKSLVLLVVLSVQATVCMYHWSGGKLKHVEVDVTNKSSIPVELSWVEIERGTQRTISHAIEPGETTKVKLGEVGDYFRDKPAKITYYPFIGDETFKQEFIIDLPNSPAFVFTAVRLADILNNILVPKVYQANDEGEFNSFQYMNVTGGFNGLGEWSKILNAIGTKKIKKPETKEEAKEEIKEIEQ